MSVFGKINAVLSYVGARQPLTEPPYDLNLITEAVTANSDVARIEFGRVEDGWQPMQPGVLGRLCRYEARISPYAAAEDDEARALIHYSASLNTCWRRFVVVKEMCHLLLDDVRSRVTTEKQLLALAEALCLPDDPRAMVEHLQYGSEHRASFAAMEILAPLDIRQRLVPSIDAGRISHRDIAEMFRVPERFVPTFFHPRYIDLVMDAREREFGTEV